MKIKRYYERLLIILLLVLTLGCYESAIACESNNDSSLYTYQDKLEEQDDGSDGVVKVITVYTDEAGNNYYAKQGTGFVVGKSTGEEEQKKYILTDYGIVEGENAIVDKIIKSNGLNAETKLQIKYYAVGDMGVLTELTLTSFSNETRYAVLETEAALADKTFLKLGDGTKVEKNARITVIAYSGERDLTNQNVVQDRQLVKHNTIISDMTTEEYYDEEIAYFAVGEEITPGMAGGPIFDNEGCVAGMFILHNDIMMAISVEDIRVILEALDIDYLASEDDAAYDVPSKSLKNELEELVRDNKEYISSIDRDRYTDKSWTRYYDAINAGEELTMNSSATEKQYEDCIEEIKVSREKLKTVYSKWIIIVGILTMVMIYFIVLCIKKCIKVKTLKRQLDIK